MEAPLRFLDKHPNCSTGGDVPRSPHEMLRQVHTVGFIAMRSSAMANLKGDG